MPRRLAAHFLPELTSPAELAGGTVAVIDVLRATTTITQALASGASEVIPCLEIDEARRVAARLPTGRAVLGGERGGLRIAGFDLGNSPSEYTIEAVGGRTVVCTTTNGTKAMLACREARRVVVAALVNLGAVCRALAGEEVIHLLCAGTRGRITREDVLTAGGIACLLTAEDPSAFELNDEAAIAKSAWLEATGGASADVSRSRLVTELHRSQGGRDLAAIGLDHDIVDVAQLDRLDCVGELDLAAWSIRLRGKSRARSV